MVAEGLRDGEGRVRVTRGIADGQGDSRAVVGRALVMVQGDLGRSPRMQYHALALAVNGVTVDLVGLAGTPPLPVVVAEPRVIAHTVRPLPRAAAGRGWFIRAAWRAIVETVAAAARLGRLPRADVVLLQVPPAVPWGVLAWILARMTGARLVLDWHNLGWTLLALRGGNTRVVGLLRAAEGWLARRGDAHLCVSRAMRDHLQRVSGVAAAVVYDRPPAWMADAVAACGAGWRRRLCELGGVAADAVILMSPTSFTDDEDLDLVAASADALAAAPLARSILFIISGRGTGRDRFVASAARHAPGVRAAMPVVIATAWFEPGDYIAALAAADAGLCLHRSSSGLDLPMKVADMFGAGLPVLALRYPAIGERLRDDNSRLFDDASGLARAIRDLWGGDDAARTRLRAASVTAAADTWESGWIREAWPTIVGGGA